MMKYEVYPDSSGQWRWRLKAGNGQIIAVSGEGYLNLQDCKHAIELVKQSSNAPVHQ
jgi:uncharacterized protein